MKLLQLFAITTLILIRIISCVVEGPNKESVPCDDIMDGNRNDKKKDADCEQSLEALLKNPFGLRCFEVFLYSIHLFINKLLVYGTHSSYPHLTFPETA